MYRRESTASCSRAGPAFRIVTGRIFERITVGHRSHRPGRSRDTQAHRLNPSASQDAEYSRAGSWWFGGRSALGQGYDKCHSPGDERAHAARSRSRCYSAHTRPAQMRSKGRPTTRSMVQPNTRSTWLAKKQRNQRRHRPRRKAIRATAQVRTGRLRLTPNTALRKVLQRTTRTG